MEPRRLMRLFPAWLPGVEGGLAIRCIAQAAQNGDTMDTDFCGNWFSKGESINSRGSQRLQGNRLVSASCDRYTMN
jgi:hypothetical protein